MKFAEINAIYTAKIAEYLSNGYVFNTNTMGGSQGDIAAIDIRKGDDVIRVRLHREFYSKEHIWGDQVVLTVGRCTDEGVIAATGRNDSATLWNNRLEVIEVRAFFEVGSRRGADWYIEGEEGEEALRKNNSRYGDDRPANRNFPGMEKLMLPAIRRHMNQPRFPLSKVENIYKSWDAREGRYHYYASIGSARCVKFC